MLEKLHVCCGRPRRANSGPAAFGAGALMPVQAQSSALDGAGALAATLPSGAAPRHISSSRASADFRGCVLSGLHVMLCIICMQ